MKLSRILLVGVACVLVLFFGFVIGRMGGADINATVLETKTVTPIPEEDVLTMSAWAEYYPLEYNSYLKTAEMGDKPGNYGGTTKYQHSEKQPEILTNFKGFGFGKDYADDRGHYWALVDNRETLRVNDKTKAACINCKTPYVAEWYEEYGWDYATMNFFEMMGEIPEDEPGISCAQCHDPNTMDLRPVNPAFIDAAEVLGIDLDNATVDEMRTYVCAQCHVTYYMESADNAEPSKVTFPWTMTAGAVARVGAAQTDLTVANIWEHYVKVRQEPGGFQQDWIHPDSGVKVVKDRHPDYETWSMGVHGQSGVSCADCHMPYKVENGQKYSSHWITSPLRHVEDSCTKCHDQGSEWLTNKVMDIQDNTFEIQRAAGLKVAEAHEAIAKAAAVEGVDEVELDNAREILRKAQMYWDFIAAESSMGFHAPDYAINVQGQALQMASEAIMSAYKAAGMVLPDLPAAAA